MSTIRTLFVGTGEFAIPVLDCVCNAASVDVVAVVTQPDKPVGRKQEVLPGPLGKWVAENKPDIPIYKPESLRQSADTILGETTPQLIIVAAYGQMVPSVMLDFPKHKCLNIHGSLLPKLRGAVPVPMAILQGLDRTGVSVQVMVEELDAGPLLASWECDVLPTDTTESLKNKLANLTVQKLPALLDDWVKGEISLVPQDSSQATFCYQADISKDKAQITFDTSVIAAERMVRAFYPWPIAWLELPGGQRLRIFNAAVADVANPQRYGLFSQGKSLFLSLHDGVLELSEVQLEGKLRKPASEYLYLAKNG